MLFVTKKIKTQLEEAKRISDIVNNDKLSAFSKAHSLYMLWWNFKDETAKNIFEMMRGSPALRKGWFDHLEENRRRSERHEHVNYGDAHFEFARIMREDFKFSEEQRQAMLNTYKYLFKP